MNRNFDIFISYKETDSNGELTRDTQIAQQLYSNLTSEGFRVFFSKDTLGRGSSSEFGKEIDVALDSSTVLIVVATKKEYMHSRWIEYEWRSFLNDILSSNKKDAQLLTFTEGVNYDEMPRALRTVQNYKITDMNGIITFVKSYFDDIRSNNHTNSGYYSVDRFSHVICGQDGASEECSTNNCKSSCIPLEQLEDARERFKVRERTNYSMDMMAFDYIRSTMMKEKYNVLVLGCGYGFEAETRFGINDDVENVVCVDIDASIIGKAKELFKHSPHMRFYTADIQSSEYVSEMKKVLCELGIKGFDIIFAVDVFRFLNNPQAALRNSRKLLSDDGMIMFRGSDDASMSAHPDDSGILNRIINGCAEVSGMPDYCIGRQMPVMIRNNGFEINKVFHDVHTTVDLSFDEKEVLFDCIFGARKNAAVKSLVNNAEQKNLVEKLLDDIDQMENIFYNNNFWFVSTRFLFVAQKN